MIRRWYLLSVAYLLLGGCGPAYQAPPVTAQLIAVSRSPKSLLERGHIIHETKCAKCHPFENPAEYSPDRLSEKIIPTMARKAKLDTIDEKAVLAYLLAARQMQPLQRPQ